MKWIFLFFICLFTSSFSYSQSNFGRKNTFLKEDDQLEVLFKKNSYFTNDSLPFKQFEKIEIGIELPADIAQKVNLFVHTNGSIGINPYLEWELAVKVIFTHITDNESYTIDAFYYRQFERYNNYIGDNFPKPKDNIGYTNEEYRNLGGWNVIPMAYQFLARFVAMKSGEWNYQVMISQGEEVLFFPKKEFRVENSNVNPFIQISPEKRYLYRNDSLFQPIGCNISWPETKREFDSIFAANNQWRDDKGQFHYFPENYRSITVAPRVYEKYNEHVIKMNQSGANWFRMIMSPQSTDIEFEELGNYTKRLHQAYELDELLQLAENKDFYLEWCMLIHYTFKNKVYGITHWDWDDAEGENIYAYKKAFNLEHPIEFFQSEDAKNYYKQRIRYILSRWGYSANIGLFEIMSEISNVGSEENESSSFYQTEYKVLERWQDEMADYIKQNYFGKIHLLTSSYSGLKHENDRSYFDQEAFDVMGSNVYQFTYEANASFFTKFIGKIMLDQGNEATKSNYTISRDSLGLQYIFKPLVFAESEPINQRQQFNNSTMELNRHWWQSLFSGLAFNLPWTQWTDIENYYTFGQIKAFEQKFPLITDQWHPGYMDMESFENVQKWLYNSEAVKWMGTETSKADLMYLRKNSADEAIGIITNQTANFQTIEGLFADNYQHPFPNPEIVNLSKEKLRVTGLKKGNYRIYYYLPNDFNHPIYVQSVSGKTLRFNYVNLRATKETYLLLFRVVKE